MTYRQLDEAILNLILRNRIGLSEYKVIKLIQRGVYDEQGNFKHSAKFHFGEISDALNYQYVDKVYTITKTLMLKQLITLENVGSMDRTKKLGLNLDAIQNYA